MIKNIKNKTTDQSALEHYGEMRSMVIRSLLFLAVSLVVMVVLMHWLIPYLINHGSVDTSLVLLGPMEIMRIYLFVGLILAIGFSIPYVGYEIWKFAKPALTDKESKMILTYIPGSAVLFILGLLFGYLIVFPIVYSFLIGLGAIHFEMMITAQQYFSFLLMTTLPIGFVFQLPIVMMFLTSLGVFVPEQMRKVRKYAYFGMVVFSVLITPPDFLSDILLIIPLILLYEFGIYVSQIIHRKKGNTLAGEHV
ncbi:twin-arginine translocase subunit TatC [Salicibibacter cibarius]|uniref:Sec-independent protein translocase protein TatC n=1 Tax=Salicibibacter cibarius TaxID=2743000 RepID=A0A7T6Z5B9_9BACI|nr:twin-arginine translocase subunit TatC [Salicibibacter cibarius]QQK77278.1 twin-arginine translocase subunit TatC [Salicibibacter cibarius]